MAKARKHSWDWTASGHAAFCTNCGITKLQFGGGNVVYVVDSQDAHPVQCQCEDVSEEKMKRRKQLFYSREGKYA